MRNPTHSRRDVLKASAAMAAGAVFAEPLKAATAEPSAVTPALIEAARKEGKISFYTALELPMGGAKASGIGSRHGAGGIRKYCSQQAIVVTPRLAMKREVHMYPYKSRTSRLLAGFFKLLYGRGKRA